MKILGNLIKILVIVLLVYVLIQNAGQKVDLRLFTLYYSNLHFSIILLLTLGVGAVLGALMMGISLIHTRAEIRELKRKNRQLTKELENLRNISIDEIPEEDLNISGDASS